ncbi:putative MFS monocarboxylate transporter [Rhizodiscina lignyota]|uniref:MFS monocarboxylate transporter n=1 Tax=Rhizodiscina lignyota TaxID=1504668 RepID=A0A9P4IIL3_9PEZI|nr:putative MFS monocarboxylate transporter [Rhizodiscina lignyota]
MGIEKEHDLSPEPSSASSDDENAPQDIPIEQLDPEKAIEVTDDTGKPLSGPQRVPTPNLISPPPNGGLQAWLHVLAGCMLFFNTWGILNAFGVYQTYYEAGTLFQESSSNIAWIGSIQAFMVLLVGFFSGPIFDRGYLRHLMAVGSFLVVFGHMMLSICKTYWEVLLAQGFCIGIGAGCLYVPSVAILPTYFSTKLGLAIGLAAAGSSLGGVIYPIVFYRLINEVGYGWGVRVMGFMALVTLIIPLVVMRMRLRPAKPRALIDWEAFVDFEFMLFTVGTLIGFMGLYVMLFYLSYYASAERITDSAMAFYVVPILNGASTFGRTLPNALSDYAGPLNLIVPGAIAVGIIIFCMLVVTSEAAIIVCAILFGFFSGVFIALPPVTFVILTKDKSRIGTRIGMGFGIIGFGVLAGGPGGGNILGENPPYNWTGLWVFGGVSALASGAIFAFLRFWRTGFKLKVKA